MAQARGARIYAELVGYGMSGDAYHMTAPARRRRRRGARRCRRASSRAGVGARRRCDYINAHGTSTPINDPNRDAGDQAVLRRPRAASWPMSSTKSMTGHLLGAAGGLEAGITALAVHHQMLPPTINLDNPDPACDLDYVPHTGAASATIELRAVELVRLRRHQRVAAVQALRRVSTEHKDQPQRHSGHRASLIRSVCSDLVLLRGSEGLLSALSSQILEPSYSVPYENSRLHQAGPDARVAAAADRRQARRSASRTRAGS